MKMTRNNELFSCSVNCRKKRIIFRKLTIIMGKYLFMKYNVTCSFLRKIDGGYFNADNKED